MTPALQQTIDALRLEHQRSFADQDWDAWIRERAENADSYMDQNDRDADPDTWDRAAEEAVAIETFLYGEEA